MMAVPSNLTCGCLNQIRSWCFSRRYNFSCNLLISCCYPNSGTLRNRRLLSGPVGAIIVHFLGLSKYKFTVEISLGIPTLVLVVPSIVVYLFAKIFPLRAVLEINCTMVCSEDNVGLCDMSETIRLSKVFKFSGGILWSIVTDYSLGYSKSREY